MKKNTSIHPHKRCVKPALLAKFSKTLSCASFFLAVWNRSVYACCCFHVCTCVEVLWFSCLQHRRASRGNDKNRRRRDLLIQLTDQEKACGTDSTWVFFFFINVRSKMSAAPAAHLCLFPVWCPWASGFFLYPNGAVFMEPLQAPLGYPRQVNALLFQACLKGWNQWRACRDLITA